MPSLLVDQALQFACNGERDFFLVRAAAAGRARIDAAMSRIDRNDDVARLDLDCFNALDDLVAAFSLFIQIHNQTIVALAFALSGRHQETFWIHAGFEIEHDARVAFVALAGPNRFQQSAVTGRRRETRQESTCMQIDDDAVGIGDVEQLVVSRSAQVERDARSLG